MKELIWGSSRKAEENGGGGEKENVFWHLTQV